MLLLDSWSFASQPLHCQRDFSEVLEIAVTADASLPEATWEEQGGEGQKEVEEGCHGRIYFKGEGMDGFFFSHQLHLWTCGASIK